MAEQQHIVRVVESHRRCVGKTGWRGPAYQAVCLCGWVGDQHGVRSNAEHQRMRHDLLNQYPPIDKFGRRPEAYYRALEALDRDWLASVLPDAAIGGRVDLMEVAW